MQYNKPCVEPTHKSLASLLNAPCVPYAALQVPSPFPPCCFSHRPAPSLVLAHNLLLLHVQLAITLCFAIYGEERPQCCQSFHTFLQQNSACTRVRMRMPVYLHDDVVLAFVNQPSRVCEGAAALRHNGLNPEGPLQTQHCCATLHTIAPHRSAPYQQTCWQPVL